MNDPIKAKIIELVPGLNGTHVFLVGYPHCEFCGVQKVIRYTQRKVLRENKGSGGKVSEVMVTEHNMEGGPCKDNPRRSITLADVLRAIAKREGDDCGRIWIDEEGRIMRGQWMTIIRWNLTADYDGQTQEVKDFIGRLLGV